MTEAAFLERYGPCALVAGGGQGIGLEFARAMVARGLDVVIADLRQELLDKAAGDLAAAGPGTVETLVLDVAAPDATAALAELAGGRELGLGVFSAADQGVGAFLEEPVDRHLRRIEVNCSGAARFCHALGGSMRDRGRGGLILLSSLAGFQGTGWVASYAATKAFDLVLAESLWWEFRRNGVDVLALVAGATDTPGLRKTDPRAESESGWAKAADVAAEGLDALGHEPMWIAGESNRKTFQALSKLPRKRLLELMGDSTQALYQD